MPWQVPNKIYRGGAIACAFCLLMLANAATCSSVNNFTATLLPISIKHLAQHVCELSSAVVLAVEHASFVLEAEERSGLA